MIKKTTTIYTVALFGMLHIQINVRAAEGEERQGRQWLLKSLRLKKPKQRYMYIIYTLTDLSSVAGIFLYKEVMDLL